PSRRRSLHPRRGRPLVELPLPGPQREPSALGLRGRRRSRGAPRHRGDPVPAHRAGHAPSAARAPGARVDDRRRARGRGLLRRPRPGRGGRAAARRGGADPERGRGPGPPARAHRRVRVRRAAAGVVGLGADSVSRGERGRPARGLAGLPARRRRTGRAAVLQGGLPGHRGPAERRARGGDRGRPDVLGRGRLPAPSGACPVGLGPLLPAPAARRQLRQLHAGGSDAGVDPEPEPAPDGGRPPRRGDRGLSPAHRRARGRRQPVQAGRDVGPDGLGLLGEGRAGAGPGGHPGGDRQVWWNRARRRPAPHPRHLRAHPLTMRVRFWGTRGSIAKPGLGTVRYGGNTSCVEVRTRAGTLLVLDCGTGAHGLGHALEAGRTAPLRGHILITHTHWDHIQGLPFFAPLFVEGNEWDVYAPRGLRESVRETLAGQMQYAYFPVSLDQFAATVRFHDLVEGAFAIADVRVTARYLNHPALTLGYRLEADGVALVYATDHEPHSRALASGDASALAGEDRRHVEFLAGADLLIHDAQYTAAEYAEKAGWGHSSVESVVASARTAGARRLVLFHHDPLRDDVGLDQVVAAARLQGGPALEVTAAAEGQTV